MASEKKKTEGEVAERSGEADGALFLRALLFLINNTVSGDPKVVQTWPAKLNLGGIL